MMTLVEASRLRDTSNDVQVKARHVETLRMVVESSPVRTSWRRRLMFHINSGKEFRLLAG